MQLLGARGVDIIVGGTASLRAVRDVVRDAGDELLMDAFKLTHRGLADDVASVAGRSQVRLLLDAEARKEQPRKLLRRAGAELIEYGNEPSMNHGKSIVGTRGALTTTALMPESEGRWDLTALLDQQATEALRELQRATMLGDTAAVRAAAKAGRLHGIVVNDPLHGVRTLTKSVQQLVGDAEDSVLVATKLSRDTKVVKRLAERSEAGADVTFATREMRSGDRKRLLRAGADVHELSARGGSVHGNAIVADGRAYVGTAYLHHGPLGRGGAEARRRREVGVIIDDSSAVDAIERAIRDRISLG